MTNEFNTKNMTPTAESTSVSKQEIQCLRPGGVDESKRERKDGGILMDDQHSISGLFPHYVIAKTKKGHWAFFKLTTDGYLKLGLSYYSPKDAAVTLVEWLGRNTEPDV